MILTSAQTCPHCFEEIVGSQRDHDRDCPFAQGQHQHAVELARIVVIDHGLAARREREQIVKALAIA